MARISLEGVTKAYPGGVDAVRGVDLQVDDGELLVLVGPSGCGKSTLLRLIAGLEEASSGEIRIGERVVNQVPPRDRDVAMVFQEYALYPHMTVRENLGFGLRMRRRPVTEIASRVADAARILGLESLLERRPAQLSGGQRQRVAVGRAIVRDPAVFLLDEPLSNLDAELRGQMRSELARLHRRLRATMVFVTHDQMEAVTLGQRIAVLKDGRVQQLAPPQELYDRPANRFVAGFIGSPPMGFLEGRLEAENGALRFRAADGRVDLPVNESHRPRLASRVGASVLLGVRPEHLSERVASGAAPVLRTTVDVVEPLGPEQLVHVRVEGQPLTARIHGGRRPELESEYLLEVAMEGVHYFDPGSGEALR